MRNALLLAAGALALSTAAQADAIVRQETQIGVYSAPVAGATPQARENPAPDTTMLEQRRKTTVTPVPSERVIEQPAETGSVEIRRAPQ
ncbi:hypothetical protein [Hansschlegelia sp.]|uniref:hypothetical protein n=1 Tax=Hansschlegelia sp. TaxID=2041892 RepID=UPI002B7ABA8E|nr:hypothetical protein [Hansschlegelia sp.]HVI30291.1 hypothetical protein [Hansschlegelia sp.]